jgi:hypothetical protein
VLYSIGLSPIFTHPPNTNVGPTKEMRYTLERPRVNQYPTEKIIAELRRVAGLYGKRHFSRREFDEKATDCKGSVVLSRFGSWQAALDAAGLKLERVKKDRSQISNDQLFEELGRIWKLIGHRPSKDEWENADAKYSYTTYKTRFSGWVNACAAFIENESRRNEGLEPEPTAKPSKHHKPAIPSKIQSEEKRNIPMKLRYRVLTRDSYKCVLCGRSPATHVRVSLHIDHIEPFAKGGKTVLQNLRTLCNECNWGKGSEV